MDGTLWQGIPVGEGFNPEVGFLVRSSFKKTEFRILRQWRPKNTVKFLEVRPHISYRGFRIFQEFKRQDFYILITIGYGKVDLKFILD